MYPTAKVGLTPIVPSVAVLRMGLRHRAYTLRVAQRCGWHGWGQTKLPQSDLANLVAGREGDCSDPSLETVGTLFFKQARTLRPYYERCRTASNKQTPEATETFKLLTVPAIGMFIRLSQCSRVRRRIPAPSAPITKPKGPLRST